MQRRILASWSLCAALGLLVPAVVLAPGCREVSGTQCRDEPLGSVSAWVEGDGSMQPIRFSGTVESVSAAEAGGGWVVSISDDGGGKRSIRFQAPGIALPVETGRHYRFEVQQAGEAPPASAVIVWDDEGLLFAGASDWEIGRNVARDGVPGFEIAKVASDCGDRSHGTCYDGLKNAVLKVIAPEESVTLYHGETAELGSYKVTCLTCQDVVYNDSCADAGLISVSYVIVRRPAEDVK